MKTSAQGIKRLIEKEGKRNKMYKDTQGYPTIGVGHLILNSEKHLLTAILTDKEVEELLQADLVRFEKAVNETIKVKLSQEQFDTLVGFAFNIGAPAFRKSKVAKLINAGAPPDVIYKAFMEWTKNKELIGRRTKEATEFISAYPVLSIGTLVFFCPLFF